MTTPAVQGPEDRESLLTPGQAGEIFQVRPRTLAKWADARLLTVHRTLRGHRRYVETEVRTLAEQLKVPADRTEEVV